MSPLLPWFLAAACLGALLQQAEGHFSKMRLSNRLDPQLGLPGLPEGAPVHSARRALQVSPVTPALQEVRMGERLELECEAFGGPPPTIQWLRDGQPIGQGMDEAKSFNNLLSADALNGLAGGLPMPSMGKMTSNQVLQPMDSPTGIAKVTSRLVIDCALPVHRGLYSCAAVSGADADVSPPATVYVEADGVRNLSALLSACQHPGLGGLGLSASGLPRITTFASFVMDVAGADITLPCVAEGSPRPEVYWTDNNNQLITPRGLMSRRNRYKVLPNGSLVIMKVRWSDMGVFTCVARSEAGRDNATTFVYPLSAEK